MRKKVFDHLRRYHHYEAQIKALDKLLTTNRTELLEKERERYQSMVIALAYEQLGVPLLGCR